MPVRPRRGSGRTQCGSGSGSSPAGVPFGIAKVKALCQLPIFNCLQANRRQTMRTTTTGTTTTATITMGNGENGKDVSAKHSHCHSLSHSYSQSYSYSLSFQFHLALAFILDLHLIWLSCAPQLPQFASPGFGLCLSLFIWLHLQLYDLTLGKAKDTQIFMRGAKTMRMPGRNSTAHLQMNRLMSAGYGEAGTPLPTLHPPPFHSPCLVYVAKFRQRTNWL